MPGLRDQLLDPERLAAVRATGLLDTSADEAFDQLTRLAALLLGTPYAFVTLVDDRRSFWKSCTGVTSSDLADRQNTVEESFCQYVVASRQPVIIGDVAVDPLTADNPSIKSMGVAAWAGFPIFSTDGHVLGTFCVVDTKIRTWTDVDVQVLDTLSSAAGSELALREAAAQSVVAGAARDVVTEGLALLADVGAALTETLDAEEAVARLGRLVVPVLGDWSIVSVVEANGALRDLASWHRDPALRAVVERYAATRFVGRVDQGPMGQAQRSATTVITTDVVAKATQALTSQIAVAAIVELAPASSLAVPLIANGHVLGVLSVCRGADRPPFSPHDLTVANGVSHRGGMALANAQLYAAQLEFSERLAEAHRQLLLSAHHDRTVARTLQDALMTRLPEPDHLHLVARYLTADGNDQVGGDWYDAVVLAGGTTTLMIGDVAGHDIAAAAVMGQIRSMLRGFAWEHDEAPSITVARLDRAIRDLHIDTTATLLTARIEQTETDRSRGLRQLHWTNAGHPPPILVHADGTAVVLAGNSDILLGVRPDTVRRDNLDPMPADSTLLLYTDGLIESREHDLDIGIARLLASVQAHYALEPDEFLDAVLAELVLDSATDDIAVLAVRFNDQRVPRPPEAGPAHL